MAENDCSVLRSRPSCSVLCSGILSMGEPVPVRCTFSCRLPCLIPAGQPMPAWSTDQRAQGTQPHDEHRGERDPRPAASLTGAQAVRETEVTGGFAIPLSSGHAALDLGIAHARRSAIAGLSETGWIFSVGIAIKPY